MISSKRPIVVYIEQARIPDETTSITRSEVPITGDIVVHHRIQNGANNKAMGDGFLKELYDVLNGAVGENLRFEDGASVFVYRQYRNLRHCGVYQWIVITKQN